MSSMGIFIGPYVLHKKVNNHMDAKVAIFLGMIPRALLMFIGAFFNEFYKRVIGSHVDQGDFTFS